MTARKIIEIGSASIPLTAYAIGGTALLGNRGKGKTWAAKGIAEQLLEHRVPIIVFDPIGVWRFLKVPAAKNGKGYPVVVAGGKGADLPLTPAAAPEIVRAAIRENISLVIDLYDRTLSKADWRRIVQTCFRTLLYENEGMRHIFLEEAAEYAPQKVQDGETYAEVEKLVRMGGNASLGITLVNQRAQEVNKAVLDLCGNLVLMGQKGAHAIEALEKWIDKVSPDFAKQITSGMPKMQPGEAWVFVDGNEDPIHTRSGQIRTFHPDREHPEAKVTAAPTDASAFVEAMQRALPAIVEQQQANDPKKLKARIAELELANRGLQNSSAGVSMTVYEQQKTRIATLEQDNRALERHRDACIAALERVQRQANDARTRVLAFAEEFFAISEVTPSYVPPQKTSAPAPAASSARLPSKPAAVASAPRPLTNGSGELGKGQRAVLTVLAQYDGADETQIAILTGYKATTRYQTLKELRASGYAERNGNRWSATPAGLAVLGAFDRMPTGRALIDYWLARLGKGEAKIFELIVNAYPSDIHKDALAEGSGYKGTTTYQTLKELRARKLVSLDRGRASAAAHLFS